MNEDTRLVSWTQKVHVQQSWFFCPIPGDESEEVAKDVGSGERDEDQGRAHIIGYDSFGTRSVVFTEKEKAHGVLVSQPTPAHSYT